MKRSLSEFDLGLMLLHPFRSILLNTIRLMKSFRNIMACIGKPIGQFRMFTAENAINFYWYDTIAFNIEKKGKFSYSQTIMHKPYFLGRWFHISKFSIIPFFKSNLWTVFVSWIVILLSSVIFNSQESFAWYIIVLMITAIGSNYYSQLILQNYNILGWLFFPFFIWSLDIENFYFLALLASLMFLSSLTVYVVAILFLLVTAIIKGWELFTVFLTILPSIVLIFGRFYPLIKEGLLKDQVQSILKAIGFIKGQSTKYSRESDRELSLNKIYRLFAYGFFGCFVVYFEKDLPWFFFLAYFLLLINELVARFADKQSIDMLFIIIGVYYLLKTDNYVLLGIYWITIANPIPYLFNTHKKGDKYNVLIMKPFDSNPLEKAFNKFYQSIEKSAKILISFNDPNDDYHKIYDSYRHLMEPAHFFANKQSILLFPHLWSVFELNFQGAPNIWGREILEVETNMKYWNIDYLIYYTVGSNVLPTELKSHYQEVAILDWNEYLNPSDLTGVEILPVWHMLKRKPIV